MADLDATLDGQLLDPPEPVAEFGVGLLERRPWIDPEFSSKVHHREQEVSNFFALRRIIVTIDGAELFELFEFFTHFLPGAFRIGPIEPHTSRAFLQAKRHQEGRKVGWEPIDDARRRSGLTTLDSFPPLGHLFLVQRRVVCGSVLIAIQVRMASPHFFFDGAGEVFRSKKTLLFGEHDLERDVEEHVAEFGPQIVLVTRGYCVIEFEDLLYEVGPQTLRGLCGVPRTPLSEIPDEVDDAPKR